MAQTIVRLIKTSGTDVFQQSFNLDSYLLLICHGAISQALLRGDVTVGVPVNRSRSWFGIEYHSRQYPAVLPEVSIRGGLDESQLISNCSFLDQLGATVHGYAANPLSFDDEDVEFEGEESDSEAASNEEDVKSVESETDAMGKMKEILFTTEADNPDPYFAELLFLPLTDLAIKLKTGVKFWVSSTVMSSQT
jgi:hypothetical protein